MPLDCTETVQKYQHSGVLLLFVFFFCLFFIFFLFNTDSLVFFLMCKIKLSFQVSVLGRMMLHIQYVSAQWHFSDGSLSKSHFSILYVTN